MNDEFCVTVDPVINTANSCIIVSTMGWTSWNWSLILRTLLLLLLFVRAHLHKAAGGTIEAKQWLQRHFIRWSEYFGRRPHSPVEEPWTGVGRWTLFYYYYYYQRKWLRWRKIKRLQGHLTVSDSVTVQTGSAFFYFSNELYVATN